MKLALPSYFTFMHNWQFNNSSFGFSNMYTQGDYWGDPQLGFSHSSQEWVSFYSICFSSRVWLLKVTRVVKIKASIDEILTKVALPRSVIISLIFITCGWIKSQFQWSRQWIFTSRDLKLLCCWYKSPIRAGVTETRGGPMSPLFLGVPSGYCKSSDKTVNVT